MEGAVGYPPFVAGQDVLARLPCLILKVFAFMIICILLNPKGWNHEGFGACVD